MPTKGFDPNEVWTFSARIEAVKTPLDATETTQPKIKETFIREVEDMTNSELKGKMALIVDDICVNRRSKIKEYPGFSSSSGMDIECDVLLNGQRATFIGGKYSIVNLDMFEKAAEDRAWELAQKIIALPSLGGYTSDDLLNIFGSSTYVEIMKMSYQEAAEKVRKWEDRIKVGDEVEDDRGSEFLVTRAHYGIDGETLYVSGVCRDGCTHKDDNSKVLTKTGKRYDNIGDYLTKLNRR